MFVYLIALYLGWLMRLWLILMLGLNVITYNQAAALFDFLLLFSVVILRNLAHCRYLSNHCRA